ncbi:MAG: hypothetical protein WC775_05790 [Patescibacteria group bacterium]
MTRTLGMVVSALIAEGYQGTLVERLKQFHENVPRHAQYIRVYIDDARAHPDYAPGRSVLPRGVEVVMDEGYVLLASQELAPSMIIEGDPAFGLYTGMTQNSQDRILDIPRSFMIKTNEGWKINSQVAALCLVNGQYQVLPIELIPPSSQRGF